MRPQIARAVAKANVELSSYRIPQVRFRIQLYGTDIFFLGILLRFVYEMILSIVLLMRSRISSIAASGKRDKDGIKAHASSTVVSAITRFISAATSNPWSSNSSPSSVSFRKVVSASCRLSNSSTNSNIHKLYSTKIQYRRNKMVEHPTMGLKRSYKHKPQSMSRLTLVILFLI